MPPELQEKTQDCRTHRETSDVHKPYCVLRSVMGLQITFHATDFKGSLLRARRSGPRR